jgi:hypothetical protein
LRFVEVARRAGALGRFGRGVAHGADARRPRR